MVQVLADFVARDNFTRVANRVDQSLDRVNQSTGILGTGFSKLQVAGVAAAGSVLAIGRAAFENALEIGKLADAASTTTDQIQRFQVIARETGGTLEAFTDGQRELGIRLGEVGAHGSGPAVDALKSLGIKYATIASIAPERQFDLIVDALLGVEDT